MEQNTETEFTIRILNQNAKDEIYVCDAEWTIQELKSYISKMHPHKPHTEDQKIIYSGGILDDHIQLKHILRPLPQEDNDTCPMPTFHLVCSPSTSDTSDQHTNPENHSNKTTTGPANKNNETDVAGPSRDYRTSIPGNNQTLYTQQLLTNGAPWQNQNYGNMPPTGPYLANGPQFMAYNAMSQMIAYQQIYANYYAQFMQNLQSAAPANNVPVAPQNSDAIPNDLNRPAPATPNRNNRAPLAHGIVNQDWLDYFYWWCRGFVFINIIYFYSSPERFMLVLCIAILIFVYKEGRWLLVGLPPPNPVQYAGRPNHHHHDHHHQGNPNRTRNRVAYRRRNEENDLAAAMDGDEPPHVAQNDNNNNNNNIHPAWSLLASFFTSLIPDTPPPAVNVN